MENKKLIGKVQERTENSLKIQNFWIKYFDSDIIKDVKVNDTVETTYTDNTKNNKTYHNGKEAKIIKDEKVNITIPDTTINTILLCIKDISISTDRPIEQTTKEFIEAYKIIKLNLN